MGRCCALLELNKIEKIEDMYKYLMTNYPKLSEDEINELIINTLYTQQEELYKKEKHDISKRIEDIKDMFNPFFTDDLDDIWGTLFQVLICLSSSFIFLGLSKGKEMVSEDMDPAIKTLVVSVLTVIAVYIANNSKIREFIENNQENYIGITNKKELKEEYKRLKKLYREYYKYDWEDTTNRRLVVENNETVRSITDTIEEKKEKVLVRC